MRHYEVTARAATVNAGLVKLTAEQAKLRAHNLKDVGDGVHEVRAPIQFKRGEQFYWDGVMNKGQAVDLEPLDAPAAQAKPDAQSQAQSSVEETAPTTKSKAKRGAGKKHG